MKTKMILNFRKIYGSLFMWLRKKHMKKVVYKQKTKNSKKNVLTGEQKKLAKNYFAKYKKISTVYHNFYTEKNGIFSEKYIPDDIYFNDINLFYNDYNAFKIVDNKTNYDKLFMGINQPEILAARKNGYWFIRGEISTYEAVVELLSGYKSVFIKRATDCGGGNGVFPLDIDETFETEFLKITQNIQTDIAVQGLVVQHEKIAQLNSSSVNTLRILTLLDKEGHVKVYSSILRVGGGMARVDNFCSGGMAVGIDDEGKLREFGYYLNGDKVDRHPLSGVVYKGYEIPSFEEAKDLVCRAHICVPHFRMVSWDVAIQSDGTPTLIEANLADGQLDFHQLTNGPLFGEDTVKILDEVYGK